MWMSSIAELPRRCSIAGALRLVGDRWSLLVLRELAYGSNRFTQIARATGAPRAVLTERLKKLEAAGVIARHQQPPSHVRYELTAAGAELGPVLLALREWGDRHVNPDDPPVVSFHSCGHEFHPRTHCVACGEPVSADQLRHVEGDADSKARTS